MQQPNFPIFCQRNGRAKEEMKSMRPWNQTTTPSPSRIRCSHAIGYYYYFAISMHARAHIDEHKHWEQKEQRGKEVNKVYQPNLYPETSIKANRPFTIHLFAYLNGWQISTRMVFTLCVPLYAESKKKTVVVKIARLFIGIGSFFSFEHFGWI